MAGKEKGIVSQREGYLEKSYIEKKRQALAKMVNNELAGVAAKLFVQKGYDQTTMEDIAEAIGMSKANLYNYIDSKYALNFVILEHLVKLVADVFNAISSLPGNVPVIEKLRKLIRGYTEVIDEYQDENIALHHAVVRLDREGRRKLLKSASWTFDYFDALLREGIKSGEFRIHNTKLLSVNIVHMCTSWALLRWYLKSLITLEEYITQETELVEIQLHKHSEQID